MKAVAYIAGNFRDKEDIQNLQDRIENETDFLVPCTWWDKNAKEIEEDDIGGWYQLPIVQSFFMRDLLFIMSCDVFIIKFNDEKQLRGALVEMGIAFSHDKLIYAIGPLEKSCMFSVIDEWFKNEEDLMDALKGMYDYAGYEIKNAQEEER